MSYITLENVTESVIMPPRLPWESPAEYAKFATFTRLGPARSIRAAYRQFCRENNIKAKDNPPSSWYELSRGETRALRRARRQIAEIEQAIAEKGDPDFPRLLFVAYNAGEMTQGVLEAIVTDWLQDEKRRPLAWLKERIGPPAEGEAGEVMAALAIIKFARLALALVDNGQNGKTWMEAEKEISTDVQENSEDTWITNQSSLTSGFCARYNRPGAASLAA